MIHVQKQPEPSHFFEKVQSKGEKFLLQHPNAKGKDLATYWREVIPDLHHAYSGICAYTCHWIPPDTGSPTVDHFKPKETYPQYAYYWDNYRLVCGALNGRKGKYEDVLDPFTLQDGWFEINFDSLMLGPGPQLTAIEIAQVDQTIKRLKLNGWTCVEGRRHWLVPYLREQYDIEYLEEKAPFLASELKRQELDNVNLPRWEAYRK